MGRMLTGFAALDVSGYMLREFAARSEVHLKAIKEAVCNSQ